MEFILFLWRCKSGFQRSSGSRSEGREEAGCAVGSRDWENWPLCSPAGAALILMMLSSEGRVGVWGVCVCVCVWCVVCVCVCVCVGVGNSAKVQTVTFAILSF